MDEPQVRVVGEPSPRVAVMRAARDAIAAQWPRITEAHINWLERNWAGPWNDAVFDLWTRRGRSSAATNYQEVA